MVWRFCLRGAANRGRSRLSRRLDQLESWSAGRISRATSGSDLCLENPAWKKYAALGACACPERVREADRSRPGDLSRQRSADGFARRNAVHEFAVPNNDCSIHENVTYAL